MRRRRLQSTVSENCHLVYEAMHFTSSVWAASSLVGRECVALELLLNLANLPKEKKIANLPKMFLLGFLAALSWVALPYLFFGTLFRTFGASKSAIFRKFSKIRKTPSPPKYLEIQRSKVDQKCFPRSIFATEFETGIRFESACLCLWHLGCDSFSRILPFFWSKIFWRRFFRNPAVKISQKMFSTVKVIWIFQKCAQKLSTLTSAIRV